MKKNRYKKYPSLDSIIKARFHGSVNIKGIRYQILYSIYKAFEEYTINPDFQIHLEGIEDLDLKGLQSNNKYIQVKTSETCWNWAKYTEVFKSFFETYSLDNKSQFILVTNFHHNNDWLMLTENIQFQAKNKARIENKVRKINNDIGITDSTFYKNINLITINEEELLTSLNKILLNLFNISSNKMAEIFIDSLFALFLNKAEKREFITKILLDEIWKDLSENITRQKEFSAIGDGLMSKLEWQKDANPDDFYDGKKVRSGHIELQLDILRNKWLDKIDKGINGANVCIIRASSGQGKSSLLYRYAHDFWDEKYIYILKSVQTSKEVELVKDFLKYIKKFNFPILLLIDNADFQTALWPEVTGFCSEMGIRVLVTIRHEDWFRFSNPNVSNYEIIQPDLDLKEAKEIYDTFSKQNRIHDNVVSYQWAFERMDEPHLLMEYVYLLTHGEMLKERLDRQIKQISELSEDKTKIEILRLISTADFLNSTVTIKKILQHISFKTDPKHIFDSLKDEYIEIKDGVLQGLHWVRSQHLVSLLHRQIYSLTETAVKLLALIPENNLAYYISNCIIHDDIDNYEIMNNLNSNIGNNSLKVIEQIFKGLFLGGEQCFFKKNKVNFDEAFDLKGHSGVSLLGMSTTPTNMINAIDSLENIKNNETIEKLKIILSKISREPRGNELCRIFAELIDTKKIINKFEKDSLLNARDIFYWLKFAGIKIDTSFFSEQFKEVKNFEKYNEKALYKLISGLYEYDKNEFFKWYNQCHDDFHSFLQYKTDSLDLVIENNELTINFIQLNNGLSPNEQAMSRLEKYREALPFCSKYSSHAINILPFDLEPSIKDTEKRIPAENMPLGFYAHLNRMWLDIIENAYSPDSYYIFQKDHYTLREKIIQFLSIMNTGFKKIIQGKKYDFHKAFDRGDLTVEIVGLLDTVSEKPPLQTKKEIEESFKKNIQKSQIHFRNFMFQFFEYFKREKKEDIGKLALHNLKDYRKHLPDLYVGFDLVSSISMDYFGLLELKEKEINLSNKLIDLFEFYIYNWKKIPIYDYKEKIKYNKELFHKKIIHDVNRILYDRNTIVAERVFIEFPLSYLPLYFTVDNLVFPEANLGELLPLLTKIKYKPSFYYLIPLFKDNLIIEGGYRISSLFDEENISWESLVPQKIPEDIISILPKKEPKEYKELSFKNDLFECLVSLYVWKKQEGLIKKDINNYFLDKLHNKILDLNIKIYKEIKALFYEFYNKYTVYKENFKKLFPKLDIDEIFKFVNRYLKTKDRDQAINLLSENLYVLEDVIEKYSKGKLF